MTRVTKQQVDETKLEFAERQKAFQLSFSGAHGAKALEVLAKFCRANESCFHEDARMHAVIEGRREVWLTIARYMALTNDEIFAYYAPPQLVIVKEESDG